MTLSSKLWALVALSAATTPGILGDRPVSGSQNRLQPEQEKSNAARAVNICCLKSAKTERKEFSHSKYPKTYETKYILYKDMISAKLKDDDGFDLAKDCEMTAILDLTGVAGDRAAVMEQAKMKCPTKFESLPAYYKQIGEWELVNQNMLIEDAKNHLDYTAKEQQKVVMKGHEKLMEAFDADKVVHQTVVTKTIVAKRAEFNSIIEKMKTRLSEAQQAISAKLVEAQSDFEAELAKAQAVVQASKSSRMSHLQAVSDQFNMDETSSGQLEDFNHITVAKLESLSAEAYDGIKLEVQSLINTLKTDSKLESIIHGVDDMNQQNLKATNDFLEQSNAKLEAEENALKGEKDDWVDTVNKATALVDAGKARLAQIQSAEKAKEEELSAAKKENPQLEISRNSSNCVIPDGQSVLGAATTYCCCQMKSEGVSVFGLVPRSFEDWTSCAVTKTFKKDVANYGLRFISAGLADTGACSYFDVCNACKNLAEDGTLIMDSKKKKALAQQDLYQAKLAKYGLSLSKSGSDPKYFYGKCIDDESKKVKISLGKEECKGDDECEKLFTGPGGDSMFLVRNGCCAAGTKMCACRVKGMKNWFKKSEDTCTCKFEGLLSSACA